jgi:NAD+ synthase
MPMTKMIHEWMSLDPQEEVDRIGKTIKETILRRFRRKGAVVAISGGVDSAAVAAICATVLGPKRVLGLILPEAESSPESEEMALELAAKFGFETITEDISPVLRAVGCYERRAEAIREVIPEFGAGWKCKVVLPDVNDYGRFRLFSVVAQSPDGRIHKARMTPKAYLGVVAATNFKQRTRKMFEYYHADRLHYAVMGTPNRLEFDQGFFVKNGDGSADAKPIGHLYKTQVYAVSRHLGVPDEILKRTPTTDTYSLTQTQEEFYFALPYDKFDLCLCGLNLGKSAREVAEATGLRVNEVEQVFTDIEMTRRATRYLHAKPVVVEEI